MLFRSRADASCRAVKAVEVMHLSLGVSLRLLGATVMEAVAVRRQAPVRGFVEVGRSEPSTQ